MASDLTIQGEVVVTSEKAEAAFTRLGGKAQRMASDVSNAASKASQAVDGIGDGAATGAEKFTRAEARMRDAMVKSTRQLEQLGKTASQKFELNLSAKGMDAAKFAPYLAELRKVEAAHQTASTSASRASDAFAGLRSVLAGYVTLQSAQALVRAADAVTTLENQLKLATGSAQAASKAYGELFEIAQRSRVGFAELGSTYASIARATGELGVSQERMLGVTESIANAMTIGGGSAQAMQAALVQLGQGMASGVLRGEELNSVMEQAPRLAKALADGLGVPIGKLREMGAAGQITSEQIVRALESQSAVLSKEVAGATLTVGQAFTQLSNSSLKAVGDFDKATGASSSLARGLSSAASAMDSMGAAFKAHEGTITTVMGVLAGGAALSSLAAVPRAIAGVTAAVSALGVVLAANPVVLALLGVGAAVGGAVAYNNHFKTTEEGIRKTIASLEAMNKSGPSIYARDEEGMRKWNESVAQRKKQIAELQQQLHGMNSAGLDTRAEDARFAAVTAQIRQQEMAAGKLAEIKQKLSGVDKDYLPTLQTLYQAYTSGAIKIDEYRELVGKLADANYKADKGGAASAKDAVDARLQVIRGGLQAESAVTKSALEDLASMRRMQQVNERDFIDQSAGLEIAQLEKRKAALSAEMAIQSSQKDSLREVAALRSQMAQVDDEIGERRKKQQREINELTYKQADAVRAVILAQRQQDQEDWAAYDAKRLDAWNSALDAVNEYGRGIAEANDLIDLEVSLLGQGERARAVAIAQYQVQLRLKKELLKIEQSGANAEEQAALRAKAETAAAREMAGVQQRVILDEWQRTSGQIDDVFRQGFADMLNDGENAWKSFTKSLATTFKTAVANEIYKTFAQKYVLQAAQGTMGLLGLGGAALASGDGAGSGGGGNGVLGAANNLSTLSSLYGSATGYSSGVSALTSFFGAGSTAGASAGSLAYANAVGALGGDAIGALAAANGTWGGVAAGGAAEVAGGTAAGAAGGASAIPIIGWIIAGIMASNAMYGKGYSINGVDKGIKAVDPASSLTNLRYKSLGALGVSDKWADILSGGPLIDKTLDLLGISGGERRFGGQYGYSFDGSSVYNPRKNITQSASATGAAFLEGPDGGVFAEDEVTKLVNSTVEGINGIFKALESDTKLTNFWSGLEVSTNDKGGVFAGGETSAGVRFGETNWESTSDRSPNAQKAMENFAMDMQQVTIQALQAATDLPKSIQTYLATLKPEEMTTEQITEALNVIGQQAAVIGEFRDALKLLPFDNLRALSYDTAEALIAAAGGMDALNANLTGYFQNYYSAEEQRAAAIASTSKAFAELGVTMPDVEQAADAARAQFRAMVDSIDVTTEAGQKQYAGLLSLQDAFADLTPAVEGAAAAIKRSAQDIASERDSLQRQVWNLQGDTGSIRSADLAKLDESNRPLQEQIWAMQDAQAAAQAAEAAQRAWENAVASAAQAQAEAAQRVRDEWKSIGDTLVDEIKRIRGEMSGGGAMGYAYAQSQFAMATAQARSGNTSAADSLPELSRSVLDMAEQSARSALELKSMQASVLASLQETLKYAGKKGGFTVPSLSVGTAYVPGDTLAQLHKGEAVIPAAFNPFTTGGAAKPDSGELQALRREVAELKSILAKVANAAEGTETALLKVTNGGVAMRTKEVA